MIFKSIFKKNIFLIVIIFLVGIISVIVSKSLYRAEIYDMIGNNLYKENVAHFFQMEEIEMNKLISISEDSFISKELSGKIRGIYFSKDYFYQLPVVEGRFFNETDFKADNNVVVVGKGLVNYIKDDGQKKILMFNDKEYEVIGLLGMETKSILDNTVLFNLKNIYEEVPLGTKIAFGNSIEGVQNNLQTYGEENTFNLMYPEKKCISQVWNAYNIYSITTKLIFVLLVITVVYLFILKSHYYSIYIKNFRMLGFKKSYIYNQIVFREIYLCICAYWIGVIFYCVYDKSYLIDGLIGSIGLMGLMSCTIFSVCSYYVFSLRYNKIL